MRHHFYDEILSRFTLRMNYNDGNTGGLCIDSSETSDGNTYNLRLYSYVQGGEQVGYIFQVNNIASSVNAITLNYNGSVNIGDNLTSSGSITATGSISTGSGSYLYCGGLRIGGFDSNTLYNVGNIGITCNSGNIIVLICGEETEQLCQ
jgi:hypothetical protein